MYSNNKFYEETPSTAVHIETCFGRRVTLFGWFNIKGDHWLSDILIPHHSRVLWVGPYSIADEAYTDHGQDLNSAGWING